MKPSGSGWKGKVRPEDDWGVEALWQREKSVGNFK